MKATKKINNKDDTTGSFIFVGLSENEHVTVTLRTIAPIRWSRNSFNNVAKWRTERFEKLLSTGFSVNKSLNKNAPRLYLLPYADQSYGSVVGFGILPSAIAASLSKLLGVEDISATALSAGEAKSLETNFPDLNAATFESWCSPLPHTFSGNNETKQKLLSIFSMLLNNEYARSGQLPFAFSGLEKSRFNNALLCHTRKSNAEFSRLGLANLGSASKPEIRQWLISMTENRTVPSVGDYLSLEKTVPSFLALFVSVDGLALEKTLSGQSKIKHGGRKTVPSLDGKELSPLPNTLPLANFQISKLERQTNGTFFLQATKDSEVEIFFQLFGKQIKEHFGNKEILN